ncbi:Hypothetical Protein RradSPS_3112 (plasmid) [Rubrobacter radiotolerans]|uniref:Uncharacterized protein n=1 Tax=Rubrobacter radiotolerans TaxID=42256 RepID=A0A023X8N5_RUBRA|nr:Hypothetical Protein RradSPS_3112 [Rubrobacter radiotolerans]
MTGPSCVARPADLRAASRAPDNRASHRRAVLSSLPVPRLRSARRRGSRLFSVLAFRW